MKKKLLTFLSTSFLALLMFALPVLFTTLNSKQTIKNSNDTVQSRTIIADGSEIDCESVFNSFEDPNLETDGSVTTFEGSQTINLSDLDGLDEVSQSTLEGAQLKVKYRFTYDKETNLVTLTAVEVHQDLTGTYEETIVDTILGAAFVNEAGNLDAVLEVDGDYILLSELQDLGMVENCGWFKNLFNKVAKAVKKVTQTTIGIIGAVATVAVPVAIGVICAATGVGLIATVAMGAVAGAAIASGTAMASTKQQDGKVDWETVGVCAGVGAAVGALASGVAYGITNAVTGGSTITGSQKVVSGSQKVANGKGYKTFNAFKKANGSAGKNQAWHHIVEQNSNNIAKFGAENIHNTGNIVNIPSGYKGSLHSKITGLYNSINKAITGSSNMTVRAWLSTKSFDFQYQFGVEKLLEFAKQLGVTVVIP